MNDIRYYPIPCLLTIALLGATGCREHDHARGPAHEGHSHERHSETGHDHHDHASSDHHDEGSDHDDHRHADEHDHDDHGPSGAHEHDHGHGDDAIGITAWTDKLELFAEHPPAITGQQMTFLAHLTILEGFQAVEAAAVTLVLDGPTRVEARVAKKLRSGIFRPTLTAPRPGTYRARLEVASEGFEDTVDGFEIVVHPDARSARRDAADTSEGSAGEPIRFLKEQQWQIPFATARATRGQVVPSMDVAGEVTTPPSGQADIGAAIAGRVLAPPTGLPRPGQSVRKGELLATIAPAPTAPEAGARAKLVVVEAEARVQAAQAAVQRAERLIADRAIAQRAVDEAKRELRVAEEALQAARRARRVYSGAASGRGGGIYRLTAPIGGIVVAVEATNGKSVKAGDLLFRVVNLSELWIHAHVPEQQAALIRSDQNAAFRLPGLDEWLPLDVTGDRPTASVINVGRVVDGRSRTVDLIYALHRSDERLRVGALLRVAVPAGAPWDGVVVPREAVLRDEGRSVVYVQVEGEAFEERTVRLGPQSGTGVGIASGVNDGERVVTLGANVIRLSARAPTTAGHGHVH